MCLYSFACIKSGACVCVCACVCTYQEPIVYPRAFEQDMFQHVSAHIEGL
jgi:hypothetical protein